MPQCMQVFKILKGNMKLGAIELSVFFLTKVLWVLVLKGKKLWSNDCLPNPMACSPNTMAQKFLQAQEAPSDHGERACRFLKRKKNLGWALDDALNDEEVVVAMVFSCGYYSTTTNGNPPSLGVSSQKISKKRLYFFPFLSFSLRW